jgi:signal transduction histidine kinase
MLKSTTSNLDDRWYQAQVPLRLAGLAAILIGLVEIPPGVGNHGRPLAVSVAATVASLAWLVMIRPPQRRPIILAALLLLVVCGGVVTGLTPGGPAVALPAVGVFEAVVRLAPAAAARLTVAGIAAMATTAVLAGGTWGPTVAGYTFALAAALLLGLNRRLYLARTEQARQLLAESQRARQEQARAAALDERARIAREIHDLLAHSLGALAVQLDVAEALLADGTDPGRVQTHLHRARGLAVDGLSEARRAVAALRGDIPPLPQLLDGLLQQYRSDGGVASPLQVCGAERSLAPEASLAALRTAQEAISNARKHALGSIVSMGLTYSDDATVLTVTDTPPAPPVTVTDTATARPGTDLSGTGAGYGLTGLRERAEILGGTLDAGPDGSGWTILLRLPAQAHAAA